GFRKLAFTGSTDVGRNVALAAAEKLIPATLELGGKSANIFFNDCDWEMAMDGVQLGILFNQGQVCCAGSRVFVQEDIYDRFVKEAVERFNKVKVGLPWEEDTQMGSQINKGHLQKILSYVEIGKEEGAKVLCGGEAFTEDGLENGAFLRPTLLGDVTNDMRVAKEEIFGPVACIIKFKTEDEVIAMANDSEFGLGGAVWTRDINRAIRVARAVETGRMWVNTYNAIPEGAPFGGYKTSGVGRETHKVMLEHYTQTKNIMINLSEVPSGFYPVK
ncbi:MAG: aldehyde dehydrogenase family protein, partial [Paenibacillaceae bacterium]|nr:aldehyde dehydrogenase family protein [Paenibacillaceae bacterium]